LRSHKACQHALASGHMGLAVKTNVTFKCRSGFATIEPNYS
jgi:hypothetical protein